VGVPSTPLRFVFGNKIRGLPRPKTNAPATQLLNRGAQADKPPALTDIAREESSTTGWAQADKPPALIAKWKVLVQSSQWKEYWEICGGYFSSVLR